MKMNFNDLSDLDDVNSKPVRSLMNLSFLNKLCFRPDIHINERVLKVNRIHTYCL